MKEVEPVVICGIGSGNAREWMLVELRNSMPDAAADNVRFLRVTLPFFPPSSSTSSMAICY